MPEIVFLHHCYLAVGSRSKVGVKVNGQGQGHCSRSNVKVKFPARSGRY